MFFLLTQSTAIMDELNTKLAQAISQLCHCSFSRDNFRLRSLSCLELTSLKIHANVTKPSDYDGSIQQLLKDISTQSAVLQLPPLTLTPAATVGEEVELSFVSISDGTPGGVIATDSTVDVGTGLVPGVVNVGGVQNVDSAALMMTESAVAMSLTVLASVVFAW